VRTARAMRQLDILLMDHDTGVTFNEVCERAEGLLQSNRRYTPTKPPSNSTMQLARTSSGVRPANMIRHNLAEPETDHSEAPVTIDYLEGFHRSA
jgi:hypothetical protein